MRIIFVRHGHPNYEIDCLTELGKLQAEAAARRLDEEEIHHIYASNSGRAIETAEYIAKGRGLEVEQRAFMHELGWAAIDENDPPPAPGPWGAARAMIADNQSLMSKEWMREYPYNKSTVAENIAFVGKGFDDLLSELGYEREGEFYRVKRKNDTNVVMASHAGSSSGVLSHIFNLPAPFVYAAIKPKYTAITIVSFDGEEGALISPEFEIANDARHITGLETENVFGN